MSAEPLAIALLRAFLRCETADMRIHRAPSIAFHDGILSMNGEVDSLRAKRLVLERAAAIGGVEGIVDRLRVAPRQRLTDRQLAYQLSDALTGEPALAPYAVAPLPAPPTDRRALLGGAIRFHVRQGVVALSGWVGALDHKRLAGVLAWWVPGTRDVINGIAVDPPEHEDDAGLAAAVAGVLARDRRLDASGIAVASADGAVALSGRVISREHGRLAENDAWLVQGVERVANRLIAQG